MQLSHVCNLRSDMILSKLVFYFFVQGGCHTGVAFLPAIGVFAQLSMIDFDSWS